MSYLNQGLLLCVTVVVVGVIVNMVQVDQNVLFGVVMFVFMLLGAVVISYCFCIIGKALLREVLKDVFNGD